MVKYLVMSGLTKDRLYSNQFHLKGMKVFWLVSKIELLPMLMMKRLLS